MKVALGCISGGVWVWQWCWMWWRWSAMVMEVWEVAARVFLEEEGYEGNIRNFEGAPSNKWDALSI